ncbi:MAG: ATP-grasp domain-containing protein [Clostridia bacterium]|jgi:predicted ATP-grasp superfamily ATP-dependent carboligase
MGSEGLHEKQSLDCFTVLLPEASGRQVLPMAKELSALGCRIITVQEHKSDLGNKTRYADKKYVVEGVDTNEEIATKFYLDLLKRESIDLVIPLSDFSAGIFAKHKEEVEKASRTRIATNDYPVFMQAFDKLNTMKVCMKNGIPCPRTLDAIETIDDVPYELSYPVLLKPRSSCGSIGLHIAENRECLGRYIDQVHSENLGDVLVQEFIPQTGRQYNAHFVMDGYSNVKSAVLTEKCRWFPLDGGASTLCRTIHNEDILSSCEKLLKTIGWVGYCDLDLMEDPRDGVVKVIEINARISANVKICFAAGINVARQILQLYREEKVTPENEYKDDVRLRCLHTDLLWFIKSSDRFKANPSWFSLKRTTDQIWSWADPLPFFAFSFQALGRYRKEMKKRER